MALPNGQGGRNYSPAPVPRGMSALDVVIQAGYLPTYAGPVEFAAWLREPVDDIVANLGSLVAAELAIITGPLMADLAAAVAAAQAARDATQGYATTAGTAKDAAVAANVAAQAALTAMQALVLSFEKATTANILAGTDDSKYITSLGNKAAMAWFAIPGAYASPYVMDWDNGLNQTLTVNKATVLGTPLHPADGQTYGLKLAWTGTGSVTLPTEFQFGTTNAGDPVTVSFNTANGKVDYVWATYDAALGKYRAQFSRGA